MIYIMLNTYSDDDSLTAYVASYVWLKERSPDLATDFYRDLVKNGGVTAETWNIACSELADYSRRHGAEVNEQEFLAAQQPIEGLYGDMP